MGIIKIYQVFRKTLKISSPIGQVRHVLLKTGNTLLKYFFIYKAWKLIYFNKHIYYKKDMKKSCNKNKRQSKMPTNILIRLLIITFFFQCQFLYANETQPNVLNGIHEGNFLDDHEEEDFSEDLLMETLQKLTNIATKHRMNADYVPGIVSVFTNKELIERGIKNVREALRMIPGIEIGQDSMGYDTLNIRGIGCNYGAGFVKIMIDDISLNDSYIGLPHFYFDMPIHYIDRIELIRGPGSAIYGEYAYAGVLNIVTNTNRKGFFFGVGSHYSFNQGIMLSESFPEYDLHIRLYGLGYETNGPGAFVERDGFTGTPFEDISYAPGRIGDSKKFETVNFLLQYSQNDTNSHTHE